MCLTKHHGVFFIAVLIFLLEIIKETVGWFSCFDSQETPAIKSSSCMRSSGVSSSSRQAFFLLRF